MNSDSRKLYRRLLTLSSSPILFAPLSKLTGPELHEVGCRLDTLYCTLASSFTARKIPLHRVPAEDLIPAYGRTSASSAQSILWYLQHVCSVWRRLESCQGLEECLQDVAFRLLISVFIQRLEHFCLQIRQEQMRRLHPWAFGHEELQKQREYARLHGPE